MNQTLMSQKAKHSIGCQYKNISSSGVHTTVLEYYHCKTTSVLMIYLWYIFDRISFFAPGPIRSLERKRIGQ